jgi:hypothetical protein
VLDRSKETDGASRRPLRRAVRGDQLGMTSFQMAELTNEGVVLGIRNLGSRLGIVEPVVTPDFLP